MIQDRKHRHFGGRVEFEKPAARLSNLSERSLKASKELDPARGLCAFDLRIG
jgi:hypothetical protein